MFELDLDADLMAILVASEAREAFERDEGEWPEDFCCPDDCGYCGQHDCPLCHP